MATIALQMYTMRNFMGSKEQVKDTLEKVAKIGYTKVQMSVPAFMTVEEVKEMLDACGLQADSALAHSMKIDEEFDQIMHEAQVLGTHVIRLDGIPKELAQTPEGFREYAAILEKAGKRFHELGYAMYYHFHAFEWVNFPDGQRGIDILLNETTPEYVGFQPDIYWLTSAGTEPSSSLRLFKGRARYMHVKDYGIKVRTGILESVPRTFASVGKGNLNLPAIVKTALEIGIEEFVVEQDECEGDVFQCITDSVNGLKKLGL